MRLRLGASTRQEFWNSCQFGLPHLWARMALTWRIDQASNVQKASSDHTLATLANTEPGTIVTHTCQFSTMAKNSQNITVQILGEKMDEKRSVNWVSQIQFIKTDGIAEYSRPSCQW